ncbi:glutathione S-transferase A-like isoform X1 [Ostrea edulis]|uniref:glutathione S-transferase A-like isoform X1 n=1 Tax=Ostrea edulis TaxID=37623 RepID=UPI0020940B21|nr:glutathione S-transferase A-like isoform X1 [Ostrea edulis]
MIISMSPYLTKSLFQRTHPLFRQLNCSLATMAEDVFLYWASGSVPCWKAMLALEEKGFSRYKNKMISFDKKEEKSPEILKLNPRGQVPTFTHGTIVVNESSAICEYLESTFKEKGTQLVPSGRNERALVLQRMYEATFSKKTKSLKEELDRWDGYLGQTGAFIAGPNFTMADVYFFPFVGFGVWLGLGLDKFPNLKAYYERACTRPSVKATWPPDWKENKSSMTPLAGHL